jgi:flagellar biogenesis protein FliO
MTIEEIFRNIRSSAKAASPCQLDIWRKACALAKRVWQISRRAPRQLRLCESLPLGDRRFVAVVEFERSRFLVGGTAASMVLLARLENAGNVSAENGSVKIAAVAQPIAASSVIAQAATAEESC